MMKIWICIVSFAVLPITAWAQDLGPGPLPDNAADFDREPAATPSLNKKRKFPGAADEEDLRVQATLPEAAVRIDARSLQREVAKEFNQQLKDETQNDLEE